MNKARIVSRFTEAQYLAVEGASEDKHEYVDGYVLAMAGASQRHVDTCANVERILSAALPGGCRATGADQRVYVEATGMYTYPDVTVACEPRQYRRLREGMALLNPRVLVEVLSRSTREYDAGEKLARYQTIASVTDVLLVDPIALTITRWARGPAGWTSTEHSTGEVAVEGIGVALPLGEVFADLAPPDDDLD